MARLASGPTEVQSFVSMDYKVGSGSSRTNYLSILIAFGDIQRVTMHAYSISVMTLCRDTVVTGAKPMTARS